jgi:hypothetical protein
MGKIEMTNTVEGRRLLMSGFSAGGYISFVGCSSVAQPVRVSQRSLVASRDGVVFQ